MCIVDAMPDDSRKRQATTIDDLNELLAQVPKEPNPTVRPEDALDEQEDDGAWFDEQGFLVAENGPEGKVPGVAYDKNGFPCAPGTEDADERHPFSFLDPADPEHKDMLRELKPADWMHFVCFGCEHLAEFLDEEPDAVRDRKAIHRMCMLFHDDEGQWYLSNKTAYACSRYRPRWYDLAGHTRKVVSWVELMHARGEVSPEMGAMPSIRIGRLLAKALTYFGIDVTRGTTTSLKEKPKKKEEEEDLYV